MHSNFAKPPDMIRILCLLFAYLLFASCGPTGPKVEDIVTSGNLTLSNNGQEISLPLETMDIYLVDPDSGGNHHETFHIHGDGIELAGAFPSDLEVVRFLGNNPSGAGGVIEARVTLERAEGGNLTGKMLVLAKTWG